MVKDLEAVALEATEAIEQIVVIKREEDKDKEGGYIISWEIKEDLEEEKIVVIIQEGEQVMHKKEKKEMIQKEVVKAETQEELVLRGEDPVQGEEG